MVGSEEISCAESRMETLVSRERWVRTGSEAERGRGPNEHGHGHPWTSGGHDGLGQSLDVPTIAPVWKAGKAVEVLNHLPVTVGLATLQNELNSSNSQLALSVKHSSAVMF